MISQETWERVIEELAEMAIIKGRYLSLREAIECIEKMKKGKPHEIMKKITEMIEEIEEKLREENMEREEMEEMIKEKLYKYEVEIQKLMKEEEDLEQLLRDDDYGDFCESYYSSIANSVIYILTNKGYDIEWQEEPKNLDDYEYWYAFTIRRRFGYGL